MNAYGLDFHHLGLAVAHPDKAVRFLTGLGYTLSPPTYDPLQKVNLIMAHRPGQPAIEVISPAGEPGPLDGLLKQRTELIYHVGYRTRDLPASLEAIKKDGHRILCVSPPKEAVLFGSRPVSFYYVDGFGLIEIIEDVA